MTLQASERETNAKISLSDDAATFDATGLIVRSIVKDGQPYASYKEYLRQDFFYSCAYCTISELECNLNMMTIDHYEPQKHYPELVNTYSNLVLCCSICNGRKRDHTPSQEQRADGLRFFKSDNDIRKDHFEINGVRVGYKTQTGLYTNAYLDLNRHDLIHLRKLRAEKKLCDEKVAFGLYCIETVPIDSLPSHLRSSVIKLRDTISEDWSNILYELKKYFGSLGRSPVGDKDLSEEEKDRQREHKKMLKEMERRYSGKHPLVK